MNENPFKILSSEAKYVNPWIQVREDRVIRPDNREWIFGIVTMIDGVTVLAYDNEGNIFLSQEYKYGLGWNSIELISWGIDNKETLLECAQRELEEETWLCANNWTYMWYIDPFTTVIKSRNHLFLARDLVPGVPHPDGWEILEINKVSFTDALKMVSDNQISHGASVAAILKASFLLNIH